MAFANGINHLKSNFSRKAFFQGLVFVTLIYAALAVFIWLNSANTRELQQSRLTSQTTIIEWFDSSEVAEQAQKPPEKQEPVEYQVPENLESGLAAAPVEGLFEDTAEGRLPVIRRKDGLTPFMAYRRPFDVYAVNKPLLAIAITDLGLSDMATVSAMKSMPPEVSLIMSPYSTALDFWVKEARARGHEVWLSLPVESSVYPEEDPGPHTMLVSASERENQKKMGWLLARTEGYIGFVATPDPVFLEALNDMRPVLGNIYNRGLAFVDSSPEPGAIPHTMAIGMRAPYAAVDIWIDEDATPESIENALIRLEQTAYDKGGAIGVIHALPLSYQKILEWMSTLEKKGYALAPMSAITGQ